MTPLVAVLRRALPAVWRLASAVAVAAAPARGEAPPPAKELAVDVGSVQRLADAVAGALQQRAAGEGFRGGVRLVIENGRGVDEGRARRTLLPRLRKALQGGPLEAADGPLTARIALSEESGTVWAVVVVDGPGLAGPATVVASALVDRELLGALGAVPRTTQGRLLVERGGMTAARPGCPLLDVALVDADGDPAHELAVLTRCGLDIVRVDDDGRFAAVAPPVTLPARRWPRVALGWLVPWGVPPHEVWLATSAGHALIVDVRTGVTRDAPRDLVPLRGALRPEGPAALRARFGSPELSLPLRLPDGSDVVVPGLPARVRDLALLDDTWIFVAEDGALTARDAGGGLSPLSPEGVGDRLLVVDLDGDGAAELVTTAATAPGEPDQLVVRRPASDGSSSTVLLRSPLSGGSVVGLAAGHLDFDARVDVVIVEESGDGGTWTLWRLRNVL